MAVDEALLDGSVGAGGPTTLRLYGWQPAALSLGVHQPSAHEPRFLRDEGIQLVRRPTGGLAVLHEHELTYSVTGSLRSAAFPGAVLDTYLRIAEALVLALALVGVEATIAERHERAPGSPRLPGVAACFGSTSAHEIQVDGRKLIGSAQVRRRGAFLQHGSIPFTSDPLRLARAIGDDTGERATDLERALGRPPDPAALNAALIRAFERRFDAALLPDELTDEERQAATLLYSWKYLSGAWTLAGVSPRGSAPAGSGPGAG